MPSRPNGSVPKCGISVPGHDQVVTHAVGVEANEVEIEGSLPVESLEQEVGSRFVVVADGAPRVLFTHAPTELLAEWERFERCGGIATYNPRTSLLRLPQRWYPLSRLVGLSPEPVRCVLADAADAEAFALLAAQLGPEALETDPAVGSGRDRSNGGSDLESRA
jgi:hypothetical protein